MRSRLILLAGATALTLTLGACAPSGLQPVDSTPTNTPPASSPSSGGGEASVTPAATGIESPAESSTPTAEPTAVGQGRAVTINVSGDLLWHNSLWTAAQLDAKTTGKPKFDFVPQLESLKDYVSQADLAICHSEVPFAKVNGPYKNYPMFEAPQEIAPALKEIGWDLCTTASNHTMDGGWDGLVRTIEVHEKAGIMTAGSFATEEQSKKPVIYTTESGVKIAVISQTFSLNGLNKAKGKPWSVVTPLDADKALADAKAARAAGADIVTIHIHAGTEYSSSINSDQKDFAKKVMASPDVDFLFGQHAHVPQPIDKVNGKWVVYGGGNLIASSGPAKPRTYDGYMAQVTFTENADGTFSGTAAEYAPTFITSKGDGERRRVYLIPDELDKQPKLAARMKESAARTRKTVYSLGVEGLTERK